MKWEVEQKFRAPDPAAIELQLTRAGAKLANPIVQVDTYFGHPARDFRQTDEALRLRLSGDDLFITYKGPRIDRQTKTRRELELPLPPGPISCEQFTELLVALGFQPIATVRKSRRVGILPWQGCEVAVALDNVDRLGSFLELELMADDALLEAARTRLQSLSQHLGLGMYESRSYLELLLGSLNHN